VWTGSLALVVYVVTSGVRGSAWTAVLKDVMILGCAVGIGIYLPLHYYGGYGAMFQAIASAKPDFLTLPSKGMSPAWFVSTVLLSAVGFYMWPQNFASTFTAKSESVFRKNAIVLPLYQLIVLFVLFTGFAAVLVVPGLSGSDADLALLRVSRATFGGATLGLIGGAGLLTALVPGSMILVSTATILAKNVYLPFAPATTERTVSVIARALVPIITLVAVWLTLQGGQAIVNLLLLGYSLVTQLFPALLASLGRRPLATAAGAIAGIATGELTVVYLSWSGSSISTLMPGAPQLVKDLNIGVVALLANVIVLTAVSLVTRRTEPAAA
jgi:SSS family solute:Na+ symporter